ncbi:MAG: hypothetical protein U5K76_14890 [Woeseiaceae bacterium]|nr:hypothetical protein [Woeseiaceae bacterium]
MRSSRATFGERFVDGDAAAERQVAADFFGARREIEAANEAERLARGDAAGLQ